MYLVDQRGSLSIIRTGKRRELRRIQPLDFRFIGNIDHIKPRYVVRCLLHLLVVRPYLDRRSGFHYLSCARNERKKLGAN